MSVHCCQLNTVLVCDGKISLYLSWFRSHTTLALTKVKWYFIVISNLATWQQLHIPRGFSIYRSMTRMKLLSLYLLLYWAHLSVGFVYIDIFIPKGGLRSVWPMLHELNRYNDIHENQITHSWLYLKLRKMLADAPSAWHMVYTVNTSDPVTVHPNIPADFPGDTMLLEPAGAEHRRVWPRIRRHCRHHGNDDERTLHIWQAVWEHRHPASVGLPLRHVGAGDREIHQAGPGDQRAQEGAPAVPHS